MNEKLKEQLRQAGVDVEKAVERFMGNEDLYWKFALRFLEDKNTQMLSEALEKQDVKEAFAAAHNLKGVCGNLSFMYLYEIAGNMTEDLRNGCMEKAELKFPEFQKNYQELMGILEEYGK